MRSLRRILVVAAAAALCACGAGRPTRAKAPGDQLLVLREELESTKQQNIYDAIRQVRPFWFTRDRRRGATGDSEIVVYLDAQQLGNVNQLMRLPISAIARVRYMSATEAQVRFGAMNGLRPAILVESARP